jgi:hypothetical protein
MRADNKWFPGFVTGAILSSIIWIAGGTWFAYEADQVLTDFKQEAVKHGYAEYNKNNGVWGWKLKIPPNPRQRPTHRVQP